MAEIKVASNGLKPMKTSNFLAYSLFSDELGSLNKTETKTLINTINQYSFCIAEQDAAFKQALLGSDVLLPDGVAITASVRFLTGERIQKIAGADLHQFLLEQLQEKRGKCFYLGSSESTLQRIKEKLAIEFPHIQAGFYSPPYKAEFSNEDNVAMIEAVNAFQPEVLFIGMTAPKQEKWAFQHKSNLDSVLICSIGAVFDFYAGNIQRPSQWWIDLGLEWLGRLIKEPKRLWKRYLYYGPVFLYAMLKEKILGSIRRK